MTTEEIQKKINGLTARRESLSEREQELKQTRETARDLIGRLVASGESDDRIKPHRATVAGISEELDGTGRALALLESDTATLAAQLEESRKTEAAAACETALARYDESVAIADRLLRDFYAAEFGAAIEAVTQAAIAVHKAENAVEDLADKKRTGLFRTSATEFRRGGESGNASNVRGLFAPIEAYVAGKSFLAAATPAPRNSTPSVIDRMLESPAFASGLGAIK